MLLLLACIQIIKLYQFDKHGDKQYPHAVISAFVGEWK